MSPPQFLIPLPTPDGVDAYGYLTASCAPEEQAKLWHRIFDRRPQSRVRFHVRGKNEEIGNGIGCPLEAGSMAQKVWHDPSNQLGQQHVNMSQETTSSKYLISISNFLSLSKKKWFDCYLIP